MRGRNIKSYKAKLLIIFIVPTFAFLYFSYLYIQKEYRFQEKILRYKYSIEFIANVSALVHTLQIEGGLSAGYIVSKKESIKKRLLSQYRQSDKSYSTLLNISKENYFVHNISSMDQNILSKAIQKLQDLKSIRKSVNEGSIDFEKEINYYTRINNTLILLVKNINSGFISFHHDSNTIDYFLKLQEYAGLQRAYTYNLLLSQKSNNKILWKMQESVEQKEMMEANLLLTASKDSVSIYKKFYNKEVEAHVRNCFKQTLEGTFTQMDASNCFDASTRYIDMLNTIYENILNHYVKEVESLSTSSSNRLYSAIVVEIISIFIILFLFYILIRLMLNEEKNKIDMQIAAYTFEAQEGVVITNAQGKILKANKSFTDITGYTMEDVKGMSPRVLKSDKHPKSFYSDIWERLQRKGQWQGEIINKRKNGEIYSEMLSVSSIKNEEGIITHYIGQFLDISEIKEAQKALQHQVDHDFLTGLLSRKALQQRLREEYSKSKRHNLKHAFLFIDLDHFKSINDNYGHAIGDNVIMEVADRLKRILREEDAVARISGDEFGVLITNLQLDSIEALTVVEHISTKILQEISREMNFESCCIKISSSIGIKLFPDENTLFEDIIIHADKAMYKAKDKGKNQFIFYTG